MGIYLDNAATSHPKPESVYEAVDWFSREVGASSGRGAYRSALRADGIAYEARAALARLFGIGDPGRIVFTSCATESLNLAIFGLLSSGDHVVCTGVEHNAVWRPLKSLERDGGVQINMTEHRLDGTMVLDSLEASLRDETRLLVVNHASNVLGTLMPVKEIARVARDRGIPVLLDAAQTAGCFPVDVGELGVDLLAFTGHKSLLGPQGTGGLYIAEGVSPRPVRFGGTGSESAREDLPDVLPDRFEVGTANGPGIAGLLAGVRHIIDHDVGKIARCERRLTAYALDRLGEVTGIELYGPEEAEQRVPVISFNVDWARAEELAFVLDDSYGIMVRAGLHCAPTSHRHVGTLDRGALRVSLGPFNDHEDIDALVNALIEVKGEFL